MSLPERAIGAPMAEDWIREALRLHPAGVRLTVSGTCMSPSHPEGSKVTLRIPKGPIRVGDVVLIRTPAGLRLHRVLLAFADRIRTKGDRGIYLDPALPCSAVIAVCETEEARLALRAKALRNLGGLLARPWARASRSSHRGDAAHARLLA